MGAHQQGLLDVGGARRAGDPVDGAGHEAPVLAFFPELAPGFLVVAGDFRGRNYHHMGRRQEVQCRRVVGTGQHDQGAGFGDAGEGPADACRFRSVGPAFVDAQQGLPGPGNGRLGNPRRHLQGHRQVVLGQKPGHFPGHAGKAGNAGDSGAGLFGLADE